MTGARLGRPLAPRTPGASLGYAPVGPPFADAAPPAPVGPRFADAAPPAPVGSHPMPFEGRLATARLRLRRLRDDDLDAMVELDSDPEVMRWLSGGTATPREFIEEVVLPGFLAIDPRRPWLGVWATEHPEGRFLGWVSLRPVRPEAPTWATLGYRLCRAAWGSGLATEAARAVLHQAFEEGDLERVEATVYEANLASQRVLEKLGLRLFRRHHLTLEDLAVVDTFDTGCGEVWEGDDLVYRLDRAGWLRLGASPALERARQGRPRP